MKQSLERSSDFLEHGKQLRSPYLMQVIEHRKLYEGRLKEKIVDWSLEVGRQLLFYDPDDVYKWVRVEVLGWSEFSDFGSAYDLLGDRLIPDSNRKDVVKLYNSIYRYSDEVLNDDGVVASKKILDQGVVAIRIEVVDSYLEIQ